VRLHQNVQGLIYRTFDVGAQAICVPHVNTAEEAQNVVDGGKFSPIGKRGMATSRQGIGVDSFYTKANDETMLIVLIEDIVAIENIEEIVKVDGIDVFFIANGDLSQSMGLIGQHRHPDVLAAADRGYEAILGAGRHAGGLVTDDTVDYFLERNIRFLSTPWMQWMEPGAKSFLNKIENGS
jgi:2-keto-3-deoxy-L-rhamnonate aldolase RhmA